MATAVPLGESAHVMQAATLTVDRYYSWMGPSSVRRDILNQYREEKKALGITKGARRTRRGARAAKDSKSYEIKPI